MDEDTSRSLDIISKVTFQRSKAKDTSWLNKCYVEKQEGFKVLQRKMEIKTRNRFRL